MVGSHLVTVALRELRLGINGPEDSDKLRFQPL